MPVSPVSPAPVGLPTFRDERGALTVLERVPFEVKRAFWLHDTKARRGGHAHRTCEQVIVCVHGSAWVRAGKWEGWLVNPAIGLYVPPGNMIDIDARAGVVLVLCSEHFDESEYIERGESYVPEHHWV
jgi:dTDP-4-dehydrorhamnose 3,5-epimerase-like enzyme